MKTMTATLLLAGGLAFGSRAETIQFDADAAGEVPRGWLATLTGRGEPKWTVVADATAPSPPNALKQSGAATFPICLNTNLTVQNGVVEVKFKPVSGQEDQAGGVVWRAKDANNYYVCRANALENNVVLYKTVAGKRKALDLVGRAGGYGVNEQVAAGQWHTLRVEFAGDRFQVALDGKHLFDVEDSTFREAGRVGVWTKADSVTLFDDFRVEAR
jgi:hypothetical protein